VFFDGVIRNWQIIVPSFGIVQGAFLITALDYKGDYAGGVTFDVSLESAGALSFTVI
jgi:TP901-1 family phage major tail protein